MDSTRYLYEIRPIRPINIKGQKPIRRPCAAQLTKNEVIEYMKFGPVYRVFADQALPPIKVTMANINDLHVAHYKDSTVKPITTVSETKIVMTDQPTPIVEESKPIVEEEIQEEVEIKEEAIEVEEEVKIEDIVEEIEVDEDQIVEEEPVEIEEEAQEETIEEIPVEETAEEEVNEVETDEVVEEVVEDDKKEEQMENQKPLIIKSTKKYNGNNHKNYNKR